VHEDPNWPAKFAITLWYIWKWRCAACFEPIEKIPREKGPFLCNKFQEILHALDLEEQLRGSLGKEPVDQYRRWDPLEEARKCSILMGLQRAIRAQQEQGGNQR